MGEIEHVFKTRIDMKNLKTDYLRRISPTKFEPRINTKDIKAAHTKTW